MRAKCTTTGQTGNSCRCQAVSRCSEKKCSRIRNNWTLFNICEVYFVGLSNI